MSDENYQLNGPRKSDGTTINPATEETLQAILAASGGGSYTTRLDEGATYTYVGKAVAGTDDADPLWQITRYPSADFSVGIFADGDSNFNNVWDDRESLSYS